ncbi:hypothetical protein Tco_0841213 [Tanacetum coccineum]|uniref:Uncharacterized protein n=1 Tax=Tanacetum coccineum TaxID=301880 RepID=A0ABQ5B005_9ASTR
MTEKMNDLIAIANKQNCWTFNYKKLNALYKDFVPQKELSVEQKYFPSSSIPLVKIPVSKNMPSESPLIKELDKIKVCFEKLTLLIQKNCKRTSIFDTSPAEIEINDFCQDQVKPILNEMKVYLEFFQNLFQRDIKEMKDVFESTEITQELSKRVIELEKDLLKFEAKSIVFEIALQHKSRENNSLKTVQKENENFMASLQLKNAHLKQTYKDLFESVQRSKIDELEKVLTQQTKYFNAVKLKLSNKTAKFEAYFEKLKKTKVVLERQLARKVDDSKAEKDQFLKEMNHLRTQLENLKGKSVETKFDKSLILGKPPADKLFVNSQISKSWFTPKVDVQKDLSKPVTAQSLPKNEKDRLLKRIAYLESKLASQDIRSCQKEYHELRTLYNALKVKFDSLNRKKRETNVSKSSKPRESVSAKVHTGESSKPFSRRVSQFTTYSLQKDRKFSKNSQSFETLTPQKGFKKRASNAKHQSFETTYSCFTPVKQVWRPIKESQTFEASTFQKSFKTRTLKGKNQVFDPHSRFTPVKQAWRPKQSHSKSFKYSKSEMLSMQNKNDSASIINNNGIISNEAKTNFWNVSSNENHKWKSSSSTKFKNSHETPSFKNQWKFKSNFKSPLIP